MLFPFPFVFACAAAACVGTVAGFVRSSTVTVLDAAGVAVAAVVVVVAAVAAVAAAVVTVVAVACEVDAVVGALDPLCVTTNPMTPITANAATPAPINAPTGSPLFFFVATLSLHDARDDVVLVPTASVGATSASDGCFARGAVVVADGATTLSVFRMRAIDIFASALAIPSSAVASSATFWNRSSTLRDRQRR